MTALTRSLRNSGGLTDCSVDVIVSSICYHGRQARDASEVLR